LGVSKDLPRLKTSENGTLTKDLFLDLWLGLSTTRPRSFLFAPGRTNDGTFCPARPARRLSFANSSSRGFLLTVLGLS